MMKVIMITTIIVMNRVGSQIKKGEINLRKMCFQFNKK